MFGDYIVVGWVEDLVGFGWQVVVEEFVEVVFVDEVDVGGVFFGVGWQFDVVCNLLQVGFFEVVDWEQGGFQLFLVQLVQEVVLVFGVVGVVQQQLLVVMLGYLCVVVGGDVFGVQFVGGIQEMFEFYFVVVQYVWVWCVVSGVFGQEVFEYVLLVFVGKVLEVEWDIEQVVYGDCIVVVIFGVVVIVVVVGLVLYEQVGYGFVLLDQVLCGD